MQIIKNYIWFSLLLVIIYSQSSYSQRWVDPHFDTHRVDYRDLGYPATNLIPADNSQITALLTHSDGFVYGANPMQLGIQIVGGVSTAAFVVISMFVVFKLIDLTVGLRVSRDEELQGLDIGEHGMEAYGGFQIFSTT